ncbi:Na-translocating system protein MpsC family protein [Aneurinibacillus sp. REN35]|uniref:Na-translocating system protein MpsC family protein n=1 Tax=Aneurinibacillus sp. REN35 TaxID=3237286 RepID=UPI003529B2AC
MHSTLSASLQSYKRSISQLYNELTIEVYGTGVRRQSITVTENKILIFAERSRLPELSALEKGNKNLSLHLDSALRDEFKRRLRERIEETFSVSVRTILLDYDLETEMTVTAVFLIEAAQK